MKPAKTFLLFAAGITFGVLLTTYCIVDLPTSTAEAQKSDRTSVLETETSPGEVQIPEKVSPEALKASRPSPSHRPTG